MTRLLYHRLLVILLAAIVVFGGWFAADWQLRQAEAAANWHEQTQVLILDAGHGGEDGGAVAPDGTVEADINLEIALRARAIAELTGVRVIMTRESAQIAYPDDAATVAQRKKADQHRRAELVREIDNAVLISIHQNCYPDRKPSARRCCMRRAPEAIRSGYKCMTIWSHILTRKTGALRRRSRRRSISCTQCSARPFWSSAAFCPTLRNVQSSRTLIIRQKLATVIIASYLQYRQSLPQTGMIT